MKKHDLLYWIPTGLLCLMMAGSAIMYLLNQDFVAGEYQSLGFPTYLLYFNAAAKLLGAVAIVGLSSRVLKEWAYAGYFYIIILAFIAHIMVGDGKAGGATAALILWALSYWRYRKRA